MLLTAAILLPILIFTLGACDNQPPAVPASGVELNQTDAVMEVGDTLQLTAYVLPATATDKTVTWLSSAPSVASVENGLVTAVSAGTCDITAMTRDGLFSAVCAVTVNKQAETVVRVTGVTLNTNALALVPGGNATLTATVLPADATDKTVAWASHAPEVVSVHNGALTAHRIGTAVITVTAADGGHTASCTVTVEAPATDKVVVTGVALSQTTLQMHPGDETALTATVQPENATNREVAWSSSAPEVATVTDGVVRAVKAGTATITVTAADGGYTASCAVTVEAQTVAVTGVALSQTTLQMHPGDETALTATVQPENATNREAAWSSSAPEVASVTSGVVRAVKAGVAVITVTTADGGYTAACSVIVTLPAATGVTLDKDALVLGQNETAKLTASLLPENAAPQMIHFESKDASVATVDAEGTVTAVGKGETVVRAYLTNSIYAECAVRVGYRLTVTIDGDGTVDGNNINTLKYQGDYCSIEAQPGFGKIFSGWFEGETRVSDTARYSFDMPANDYALTARFADDPKMPECVNGVYQIVTQDNLLWATQNPSLSYLLLNDLPAVHGTTFTKFTGVFDGGGHTVTGISYEGKRLFTVIEGTVKNLTLSNVTIMSADVSKDNGLFANTANNATLINCHVSGALTETDSYNYSSACAGGLIGNANNTTITGCSATVKLNAMSYYTGGLVGKASNSNITGSFARAEIVWSRSNESYVGGFIGDAAGSTVISDCSASGSITIAYNRTTSNNLCYAAGFAARNYGTVQSCLANVNTGATTAPTQSVFAGFCAENNGKIARALALGGVSSDNAETALYAFGSNTGTNELTFVKASEFSAGIHGFATAAMLGQTSFYRDTLSFNADAWAYAPGKLPALQGDTAAELPEMVCAPGSLGNPIPVSTAEELEAVDMEKSYYLTGNIDFAGRTLNPLGLVNATATPYRGNFDGRNFVIRNVKQDLNIYGNDTLYCGLFAAISGSVVNLRLENYEAQFQARGKGYYGALAGSVWGRVENCSVSGTIHLQSRTSLDKICLGGLTGEASGVIKNSGANVAINVTKNTDNRMAVGGLIGYANGLTQNCYAKGDITFTGTTQTYSSVYCAYVGGFYGEAGASFDNAAFINCYASGNLYTDHVYASAGAFGGTASNNNDVSFQSCAAFGNVSVDLARPQGGSMNRFVNLSGTGTTENIFVYEGQTFTDLSDNSVKPQSSAYPKATAEECNNPAYWEGMGWRADVWDFTNLDAANKVLPVLK